MQPSEAHRAQPRTQETSRPRPDLQRPRVVNGNLIQPQTRSRPTAALTSSKSTQARQPPAADRLPDSQATWANVGSNPSGRSTGPSQRNGQNSRMVATSDGHNNTRHNYPPQASSNTQGPRRQPPAPAPQSQTRSVAAATANSSRNARPLGIPERALPAIRGPGGTRRTGAKQAAPRFSQQELRARQPDAAFTNTGRLSRTDPRAGDDQSPVEEEWRGVGNSIHRIVRRPHGYGHDDWDDLYNTSCLAVEDENDPRTKQMREIFGPPIALLRPGDNMDVGLNSNVPAERRKAKIRNMAGVMGVPASEVRTVKKEITALLRWTYRFVFRKSFTKHSEQVQRRLMFTIMQEYSWRNWKWWQVKAILYSMAEDAYRNIRNKQRAKEILLQQIEDEMRAQETEERNSSNTMDAPSVSRSQAEQAARRERLQQSQAPPPRSQAPTRRSNKSSQQAVEGNTGSHGRTTSVGSGTKKSSRQSAVGRPSSRNEYLWDFEQQDASQSNIHAPTAAAVTSSKRQTRGSRPGNGSVRHSTPAYAPSEEPEPAPVSSLDDFYCFDDDEDDEEEDVDMAEQSEPNPDVPLNDGTGRRMFHGYVYQPPPTPEGRYDGDLEQELWEYNHQNQMRNTDSVPPVEYADDDILDDYIDHIPADLSKDELEEYMEERAMRGLGPRTESAHTPVDDGDQFAAGGDAADDFGDYDEEGPSTMPHDESIGNDQGHSDYEDDEPETAMRDDGAESLPDYDDGGADGRYGYEEDSEFEPEQTHQGSERVYSPSPGLRDDDDTGANEIEDTDERDESIAYEQDEMYENSEYEEDELPAAAVQLQLSDDRVEYDNDALLESLEFQDEDERLERQSSHSRMNVGQADTYGDFDYDDAAIGNEAERSIHAQQVAHWGDDQSVYSQDGNTYEARGPVPTEEYQHYGAHGQFYPSHTPNASPNPPRPPAPKKSSMRQSGIGSSGRGTLQNDNVSSSSIYSTIVVRDPRTVRFGSTSSSSQSNSSTP
ncbi:hypothetical protein BJ508DRAFT_328121 [Ascobolus immersus RN42]|uniref:Uncharacterized protein n=1 Tax=Ascobolus immersus RN42 TaxID=1160509 RepID=A0A3N4I117_ASCIM|nr:hypothetical protein BJ508DRAFT_328121 [Ascobolus immersus RN42]